MKIANLSKSRSAAFVAVMLTWSLGVRAQEPAPSEFSLLSGKEVSIVCFHYASTSLRVVMTARERNLEQYSQETVDKMKRASMVWAREVVRDQTTPAELETWRQRVEGIKPGMRELVLYCLDRADRMYDALTPAVRNEIDTEARSIKR